MSDSSDVDVLRKGRDPAEPPAPGSALRKVYAREGYRLWASTYDADPNPLLALESRVLEPLLRGVRGKVVLDIACGTGRWLEKLMQRGVAEGVGVDFSASMLSRAALKSSLRGRLVQGDCLALPFRGGFADIVICSFVVGYLNDLGTYAGELARVTRPGADVLVTDFHPAAHQHGWRRSFHHGEEVVEIHSVAHSLDIIQSELEGEGFELRRREEACLGEPERQIFVDAGKEHLFESAVREPAIFACHFRKVMASTYFITSRSPARVAGPRSTEHAPPRALKLVGARVALDGHTARHAEIEISQGRIQTISERRDGRRDVRAGTRMIDMTGYVLLPGLINAHEHLEFNLFPRMGEGPHANFEHWARQIYHPESSPIRELRDVPKPARLWWGAIKNLLAGVTTVCHHNPYQPEVFEDGFPVRVVRRFGWAHSLALEADVAAAFRATPADGPFIIHLGEGTDERSREEIFALDRLGMLDSRTVIVHGVGLDAAGHALLRARGAGLVWCPTSNLFTLGRTLARDVLEHNPRIAMGSDSALTAEGDLLDELRAAHAQTRISVDELYCMVTTRAAELLMLSEGEGTIAVGNMADLTAIRDSGEPPAELLSAASFRSIELVLLGGRTHLLSLSMADRFPPEITEGLSPLRVEGEDRLIRGAVPWLLQQATEKLGSDLRLAGKRIKAS